MILACWSHLLCAGSIPLTGLESTLHRKLGHRGVCSRRRWGRYPIIASLIGISGAASWLYLLHLAGQGMGEMPLMASMPDMPDMVAGAMSSMPMAWKPADFALMLAMWRVMMVVGMMLPSAAPHDPDLRHGQSAQAGARPAVPSHIRIHRWVPPGLGRGSASRRRSRNGGWSEQRSCCRR